MNSGHGKRLLQLPMVHGKHVAGTAKMPCLQFVTIIYGAFLYYHLCQKERDEVIEEELYRGTSKSSGFATRVTFQKAKEEEIHAAIQQSLSSRCNTCTVSPVEKLTNRTTGTLPVRSRYGRGAVEEYGRGTVEVQSRYGCGASYSVVWSRCGQGTH